MYQKISITNVKIISQPCSLFRGSWHDFPWLVMFSVVCWGSGVARAPVTSWSGLCALLWRSCCVWSEVWFHHDEAHTLSSASLTDTSQTQAALSDRYISRARACVCVITLTWAVLSSDMRRWWSGEMFVCHNPAEILAAQHHATENTDALCIFSFSLHEK